MTLDQYKRRKLLHQQLSRLNRQEESALLPAKPSHFQEKTAPVIEKISDKIPPIAIETLKKTFQKGFSLVFEKGTGLIGKVCKETARLERCRAVTDLPLSQWAVSKLDWNIKRDAFANTAFSATEGVAMGAIGVALPDVLILLSLVFKTLYEVSLGYGYDYRGEQEQIFQLLVIAASLGELEARKIACQLARRAGEAISARCFPTVSKKEAEALASAALCGAMLQGKLVQGIPIVGAYGGISNGQILSHLNKMAQIQYKRRFLCDAS